MNDKTSHQRADVSLDSRVPLAYQRTLLAYERTRIAWYRIAGSGARTPLVLLHGGPGTSGQITCQNPVDISLVNNSRRGAVAVGSRRTVRRQGWIIALESKANEHAVST
jgi:hypothetical protein